MSKSFSPLILPTEDNRGLQSSVLTLIDALNAVTPRLGVVEDILAAAGLATRRIGAVPMTWLGVWTASFVYLRGDVVLRNLFLMIANKTTTETPSLSANDWDLLCICAPIPTGGSLAVTEGIDVLAAAGEVPRTGDLAVTEAIDVLAAEGEVGAIVQPLFANIMYLPDHGVAADESTSIIDRSTSASNHSFFYENNAKNDDADTALSVGGTSILFDQAASSRIRRTYNNEFRPIDSGQFDSGEFCHEMHVKVFTVGAGEGQLFAQYNATLTKRVMFFKVHQTTGLTFQGFATGGPTSQFVTLEFSGFTLNAWHHVAVTRENGFSVTVGAEDIIRMFSDGVLVDSKTIATTDGFNKDREIGPRFGNQEENPQPLDGRIDNIRIINNEPLYTQAFTPPIARHPMFE